MLLIAPLVLAAVAAGTLFAQSSYRAEIEKWRKDREANLQKDDGWLTITGLYWLKEGQNRAGSSPGNEIVLPSPAPPLIGVFTLRNGQVTFRAEPGVEVTLSGKPVGSVQMQPDSSGSPTTIQHRALFMWVIERSGRYAIRLRDLDSPLRRDFRGLRWFPIDEKWRIRARWVPYNPPKELSILNIVGLSEKAICPGYASFQIDGKQFRLEPTSEGGRLFFVFRDLTAGRETYPAGRFLYADPPEGGYVVLDFNKAYNPPCAFTPYATCPLPTPENRLPVRIPAGERNPPGAQH